MNNLTNKNEIELVKFIGRYQYLSIKDIKYFFNNISYARKRITRLVKDNVLRRYNKCLIIGKNGVLFLESMGQKRAKLRYDKKYVERLKSISHIAAYFNKCSNIKFTPSFEMKDKEELTETSRRFIGVLNVFGREYLTYHIPEYQNQRYINSVIFDLNQITQYKNIIILVNDINRLELSEFAFNLSSVIICEDSDEGLEKLKYLELVKWNKIVKDTFGNNVKFAEYKYADFTDGKNKYISVFYLLDTEKISKLFTFHKANPERNAEVVCSNEIAEFIKKVEPRSNITIVNINDYIERTSKIYDEENNILCIDNCYDNFKSTG